MDKLLDRIQYLNKENEVLRKELEDKNKFLEQLGISSNGEFRRIKYYIDNLLEKEGEKHNE